MACRPRLRAPLPTPEDHAFADGPSWLVPLPPRTWSNRLADRLAAWLEEARYGRLARAVEAQFQAGAVLGPGVRLAHTARLVNRGPREAVRIGAHGAIRGLIRNEARATLEIGEEVYMGDGALISSAERIVIGRQTLLAHGAQVFDNGSHPIDALERAAHFRAILGLGPKAPFRIPSSPVTIGENCWICMNAIVLPGSRVGDRSIVGAGTVVKGEVPPDVLYGVRNGAVFTTPIAQAAPNEVAAQVAAGAEGTRRR